MPGRSLLEAAAIGFDGGDGVLVGNVLEVVTGDVLLVCPGIRGTMSLDLDASVLPGDDNAPVSLKKAFPMLKISSICVHFLVTGSCTCEGVRSNLPDLDGVAVVTPSIVCILCIPLVSGGDNTLTRAGFLLLLIMKVGHA